jgi:hypothetical protein
MARSNSFWSVYNIRTSCLPFVSPQNADLTQALQFTLDEVREVWSVELQEVRRQSINRTSISSLLPPHLSLTQPIETSSVEKNFGFMTKRLYGICVTIVEARNNLQQENYENILEMNRQHRFEFNFGGSVRSHDDQWTSRVLVSVKEEVQSIEHNCSHLLTHSLHRCSSQLLKQKISMPRNLY